MAEDNATTLMTPDLAVAQAALVHPAAPLAQCQQGGLEIELSLHDTAIWVKLRRDDIGGLALRMPVFSPDVQCRTIEVEGALAAIECSGRLGLARLILRGDVAGTEQLRATMDFTPTAALSLGELPRDLVPFGADGDPQAARIKVEATQRKLNTALVYFTVERPEFGKVLYLQNLTALNHYFNATGSKPENAVKGDRNGPG